MPHFLKVHKAYSFVVGSSTQWLLGNSQPSILFSVERIFNSTVYADSSSSQHIHSPHIHTYAKRYKVQVHRIRKNSQVKCTTEWWSPKPFSTIQHKLSMRKKSISELCGGLCSFSLMPSQCKRFQVTYWYHEYLDPTVPYLDNCPRMLCANDFHKNPVTHWRSARHMIVIRGKVRCMHTTHCGMITRKLFYHLINVCHWLQLLYL